jgi:sulfur-oxidizing protein SoxY
MDNAAMTDHSSDEVSPRLLGRRDFVAGAGAAALVAALLAAIPEAKAAPSERSEQFTAALAALLAGATPHEGGIEMDLPGDVENGDYVPVALAVDSPMTEASHVKSIHLLSTLNPRAEVATFRFTLLSGKARVTSRMRLAKSQDVIAIAQMSDGSFLIGTRAVSVKVGGCGI